MCIICGWVFRVGGIEYVRESISFGGKLCCVMFVQYPSERKYVIKLGSDLLDSGVRANMQRRTRV